MSGAKKRLDEVLVDRGLAPSRTQAQALILGGKVRSGTVVLDKAGQRVSPEVELVIEASPRYVSRGGDKLAGFFAAYPLEVADLTALDIGASTGGFTDYLLQHGAREVTCVDVGYGQLHYKLRQDPRVANLERVNARALETAALPHDLYDLAVMDVSFISVTKVLSGVAARVREGGHVVSLIKPQFEAGKEEADAAKGVIRDPAIHARVIAEVRQYVATAIPSLREVAHCQSPLTGADGNVEFFLAWRKG